MIIDRGSGPLTPFPSLPVSPLATPSPLVTPTHPAPRPIPPVLLITDVHGPCYVQVTYRGRLLTRTILRQGHQLVFRHHGLGLVLGNAGAVRLRINGHHALRPGHFGQVRNLRVK